MRKLVGIVAGEASGDLIGSHLIRTLKKQRPDLDFVGIAGPKMIAEGAQCVVSAGGSSDRVMDGLKSSGLKKLINIAMAQLTLPSEFSKDVMIEAVTNSAKVEPELVEAANEPLTHDMGLSRPNWSVEIPQSELHG